MLDLFTNPAFRGPLAAAVALGAACALLSVLVVLRRWAFIGEGISHAGFGGVGTAWLLSLAVPALGGHDAAYVVAVAFCLAMAVTIGFVSRRDRLNADAAIGIVMVASLAWGFIALTVYERAGRPHGAPSGWDLYLLGDLRAVTTAAAVRAVVVSAAVCAALWLMAKEILFYCLDPELAELAGVRATAVHYTLMLLLALVIVTGMQLAGYLLVTALLVLPGATALSLSQRLRTVLTIAVVVGVTGTVGGLALKAAWPFLPTGPAMAMVLIAEFGLAFAYRLVARRA
ncbi:MAG: metal ABC transporter permease [Phycisphaerae bacterium]